MTAASRSHRPELTQLASLLEEAERRVAVTVATRVPRIAFADDGNTELDDARTRFDASRLVASLLEIGVPLLTGIELLFRVCDSLENTGLAHASVSRNDFVATVLGVLRKYPGQDAARWAHAFANRHGWEYELLRDYSIARSDEFLRIADREDIRKVVKDTLSANLRSFQVRAETKFVAAELRKSVADNFDAIVACTEKSVSAFGGHKVTRTYVANTAREVASWVLSRPASWAPEARTSSMQAVASLLTDARQALTLGIVDLATPLVDDALRVALFVLMERFDLWVGLIDNSADRLIRRVADRLSVVAEMHRRKHGAATAQHGFYSGELLSRAQSLGIGAEQLLLEFSAAATDFETMHRESGLTPDQRLPGLRLALSRAEKLANWVTPLVAVDSAVPDFEAYFLTNDVHQRGRILDDVVQAILQSSRLSVLQQSGHVYFTAIPTEARVLSGLESTSDMAFVSVATVDKPVDLPELLPRLATSSGAVRVIMCPSGFTERVHDWLRERRAVATPEPAEFLWSADAIRRMAGLPTELARLLEEAAQELIVSRPLPVGTPAHVLEAFERAREHAVQLHFDEAVHTLAVEFERVVRRSTRGWLQTVYGNEWAETAKGLAQKPKRLDLSTCATLLRSRPFRAARAEWLREQGILNSSVVATLPDELSDMLPTLTRLRNASAHGVTRTPSEAYREFRDTFRGFLKAWVGLDHWPRQVAVTSTADGHSVFTEFGKAKLVQPVPTSARKLVSVYVFASGWNTTRPAMDCAIPATVLCPHCDQPVLVSDLDSSHGGECSQAAGVLSANTTAEERRPDAHAIVLQRTREHGSLMVEASLVSELISTLVATYPDAAAVSQLLAQLPPSYRQIGANTTTIERRWRQVIRQVVRAADEKPFLSALLNSGGTRRDLSDIEARIQLSNDYRGISSEWSRQLDVGESSVPDDEAPPPDDVAATIAARNVKSGRRVGLFVGVNTYGTREFGSLRGCVNDAVDIYQTLCRFGGFDENSELLVDDPCGIRIVEKRGGWAAAILSSLRHSATSLGDNDLITLFIAAHGTQLPSARDRGPRSAIVLPTYKSGRVAGIELIGIDEINDVIRSSRVGSSLRVYDCCYSGQSGLRGGSGAAEWLQLSTARLGDAHCALAACTAEQVAFEKNGRGVLSDALGRVLRGEGSPAGRVQLVTLLRAIDTVTHEISASSKGVQQPTYDLAGRGPVVLTAIRRQ